MEMSGGWGQGPLEGDWSENKESNWLIAFVPFLVWPREQQLEYLSGYFGERTIFFTVEDSELQKMGYLKGLFAE